MKRLAIGIALLALLLAAAPASAKQRTYYYDGKTVGGESLSLALKGKRVFKVDGYISATCVPTHGTPVVYSVPFKPPGSFLLGRTRKAHQKEYMPYKGDVRKNYTVRIKQKRGRVWAAKLQLNFSYEEVTFGDFGELVQTFYVCTGNDEFRFIV